MKNRHPFIYALIWFFAVLILTMFISAIGQFDYSPSDDAIYSICLYDDMGQQQKREGMPQEQHEEKRRFI